MNWLRAYVSQPNQPVIDRPVESTSTIDAHGSTAPCDEDVAHESYRLIAIDSVHAPEECNGSDWHRYRIAQGENGITGYRRGDLARVTAEVEAIVTALNERREWKKTKASSKNQRRATAAPRRPGADTAPERTVSRSLKP